MKKRASNFDALFFVSLHKTLFEAMRFLNQCHKENYEKAMAQIAVWQKQPIDYERELRYVREREERCRRLEQARNILK